MAKLAIQRGEPKYLDKAINWLRIQAILTGHYDVGSSDEGAGAYPPFMLWKYLLEKWFRAARVLAN